MELSERVKAVASKKDLAAFVTALRLDLQEHPEGWENPTLDRFLEAMEGWIEDMDGYYANSGQELPVVPNWKTFADILYAAKIYE